MKNNERGFKGFFRSFRCAASGIMSGVVNERNLRIHIVAMLYVLYFSSFYQLSRAEFIALVITVCVVIITEMLNTAVEAAVDLVTERYATLAKAAKDAAAGAVLVATAMSVVIGVVLFWDTAVFAKIAAYFIAAPVRLFLLMLSAVCAVLFMGKIGPWAKKADSRYGLQKNKVSGGKKNGN